MILWLGPVYNEVKCNNAVSAAAETWQRQTIETLGKVYGREIFVLSYEPVRTFPQGRLFVSGQFSEKQDSLVKHLSYLNISVLREFIIGIQVAVGVLRFIITDNDVKVIAYNNSKVNWFAGTIVKFLTKCNWTNVVADNFDAKYADLNVYLSFDYYQRSEVSNKLHYFGGFSDLKLSKSDNSNKFICMFMGSINSWTGIFNLVDSFKQINSSYFELHIYGRGEDEKLLRLIEGYATIKFHGFVTNRELEEAMSISSAFINPRPTQIERGDNNFPSKIISYLEYDVPVISTNLKSVSVELAGELIFYDEYDVDSLVNALELARNTDRIQLQLKRERLISDYSITRQAKALLSKANN